MSSAFTVEWFLFSYPGSRAFIRGSIFAVGGLGNLTDSSPAIGAGFVWRHFRRDFKTQPTQVFFSQCFITLIYTNKTFTQGVVEENATALRSGSLGPSLHLSGSGGLTSLGAGASSWFTRNTNRSPQIWKREVYFVIRTFFVARLLQGFLLKTRFLHVRLSVRFRKTRLALSYGFWLCNNAPKSRRA